MDHVLLPDRSHDSEQSSDELTTDYTPPPQEVTSPRKSFFSIYLKLPKALFSCFQPITSSLDEDIKVKDKDCAASCPLNDTDLVVQVDQFEPQPTTKSPQAQEPIRARHRRTMSHAVTEFEAILNSDINRQPKTQMSSNEQRPGTLHENATKSGLVKPYRRKFRPFRCFSKIPSSSKLRHTYPGIIYQPRN